jgi:hypothetical protein
MTSQKVQIGKSARSTNAIHRSSNSMVILKITLKITIDSASVFAAKLLHLLK